MSTEYKVANPMVYTLLKENAKHMKQYPTEAESVVWELVRRKQLGVVFKRQYIIDEYIVDFVCLDKHIVIEIDGGYHLTEEQQERDKNRDERLVALGYKVLRFRNSEVLGAPDIVLDDIKQEIGNVTPHDFSKNSSKGDIASL